jgi:hypothetical protein
VILAQILASLGPVVPEPSCIVEIDASEVVRHARPMTAEDREVIREQQIARMVRDHAAIQAREATEVQWRRGSLRVVGGRTW